MMRENSPQILLVDDDPDDHFFMKAVIKEFDPSINVISVYNGIQALEYLKKEDHAHPDLILTDLNMPVLNGLELLKQLKDDNKLKKIPVFIISTSKQPKMETECLESGAMKYYLKPISTNDLKSIIDDVFELAGIKD